MGGLAISDALGRLLPQPYFRSPARIPYLRW